MGRSVPDPRIRGIHAYADNCGVIYSFSKMAQGRCQRERAKKAETDFYF